MRLEQDQFFHDAFTWSGVNPATHTLSYRSRYGDYENTRHSVDVYASGPFTLWGREHRALFGYQSEKWDQSYQGFGLGRQRIVTDNVPFGRHDLVPDPRRPYTQGGDTDTRQSGVYGQLRLRAAEPLTVVLGGRWSWYKTRSRSNWPATPTPWEAGGERVSGHFTPYAAVLYDINPVWTAYASFSDIFAPQDEQAVSGETLKPREGRQFELGAKAGFMDGRLLLTASVYDMRDVNRARTDLQNPDYYVNDGEVQSRGWDVEVVGRPAPGWEVQAGYTRQNSKYTKDARNQGLKFRFWEPRHILKLWGMRHFESGPLQGLSVGLGVNAYSASASEANSQRRQGGYAVASLMARYRINSHWDVQLNANNLFDRTYYTRLGGLGTYNTYGDPRNFQLTLRAQF